MLLTHGIFSLTNECDFPQPHTHEGRHAQAYTHIEWVSVCQDWNNKIFVYMYVHFGLSTQHTSGILPKISYSAQQKQSSFDQRPCYNRRIQIRDYIHKYIHLNSM